MNSNSKGKQKPKKKKEKQSKALGIKRIKLNNYCPFEKAKKSQYLFDSFFLLA